MTEKLFVDPSTNIIYSYPGDGSLDNAVLPHLLAVTQAQADAIRNPPLTLVQAQANAIQGLTLEYQNAIQQSVSYMGTTFQADTSSQDTLSKTLVALAGTTPSGFYWVDASNNQVAMTYVQLQGLAGAMMSQGWAAFQNLQNKKKAVTAAKTVSAAQNVVW